jgi:hypothetical protein
MHHVASRTLCEHSTIAGPTQIHVVAALPSVLLSGLATTAFAEDASTKLDAKLVALGEQLTAIALLPETGQPLTVGIFRLSACMIVMRNACDATC